VATYKDRAFALETFKCAAASGSRPKPFKNQSDPRSEPHFAPAQASARRPGQQRASRNVAGRSTGAGAGKWSTQKSTEMRPGVERMAQMQHAVALFRRQFFFQVVVIIAALGDDPTGRPGIFSRNASTWSGSNDMPTTGPGIAAENLCHSRHQLAVAVKMALHSITSGTRPWTNGNRDRRATSSARGILNLNRPELACGRRQAAGAFR